MKKVINVLLILIILLCINTNAETISVQKQGSVSYLYGDNFYGSNLEYQIFSYENKYLYQLDGYKKELGQERELEPNGYVNDPGLIYILDNGYPTKTDKYFYTKYEISDTIRNVGYYVTQAAIDMYSQTKNNNPSLKIFGAFLDINNEIIGNFTGFEGTGQSRKIYDAIVDLYCHAIDINNNKQDYKEINFNIEGLDKNGNIKMNFEYGRLVSDVLKLNTDAKIITLLNSKVKILNKDKKELEVQALNNNDEFRIAINYNKKDFSVEKEYILNEQLMFNLKGENTSVINKFHINDDVSDYIDARVENKPIEKNININLGYKYIDYPTIKIGNRDDEDDRLVIDSEISLYDSNDVLVDHWKSTDVDYETVLPFGDYYIVVDKQSPNYKDIFNYIEFSLRDSGEHFIRINSERKEVLLPDTGINSVKVNYLGIAAVVLCMICFLYMGLRKEN